MGHDDEHHGYDHKATDNKGGGDYRDQSPNGKKSATEQPIHHLHGEKRLFSSEIAPFHVAQPQPPRLQPIPDAPLTGSPNIKIDECTRAAACYDSRQGTFPKSQCALATPKPLTHRALGIHVLRHVQ
jgi:hypothetical protein